jgi:multimeric flavodoxin WrbA
MTKIAVVYHSGYGHTKVVAECVAAGAKSVAGSEVSIIAVAELPPPDKDRKLGGRWDELAQADAIIFGAPTYMGSLSAEFKKFMESSAGLWFTQAWKDKVAGGFTNSGSMSGDKLNALFQLAIFAGQHSMIWVSTGMVGGQPTGAPDALNRISSQLGVMTQSDQASPEVTPPKGDRATAEAYGKRVAEITARFLKGK